MNETVEARSTGASHARGRSKQTYATPPEFMAALTARFGHVVLDLAASAENTKAETYITEELDSLTKPWAELQRALGDGLAFCNPPFGNIAPWARKCAEESTKGAHIAFLVPASVGANWYRDHVHNKARVYFLNGRISFDGVNGFPKDLMCCLFGPTEIPGCEIWTWKNDVAVSA